MKNIKKFTDFVKHLNETIEPEDFFYYKNHKPKFSYDSLDDFKNALEDANGMVDSNKLPWGDIISIDDKKYIMSEYGSESKTIDYMIFSCIENPDSYFYVVYKSITRNRGEVTSAFEFIRIDDNTE